MELCFFFLYSSAILPILNQDDFRSYMINVNLNKSHITRMDLCTILKTTFFEH